jgi:hypothetical protein
MKPDDWDQRIAEVRAVIAEASGPMRVELNTWTPESGAWWVYVARDRREAEAHASWRWLARLRAWGQWYLDGALHG